MTKNYGLLIFYMATKIFKNTFGFVRTSFQYDLLIKIVSLTNILKKTFNPLNQVWPKPFGFSLGLVHVGNFIQGTVIQYVNGAEDVDPNYRSACLTRLYVIY